MFCPKACMNTHFFVSTNFVCNLLLQSTRFLLQLYASKTPRAGRFVLLSAGRFVV
nr:MAG TPA: hypothetical protein [Caudoviricetes sp.]